MAVTYDILYVYVGAKPPQWYYTTWDSTRPPGTTAATYESRRDILYAYVSVEPPQRYYHLGLSETANWALGSAP